MVKRQHKIMCLVLCLMLAVSTVFVGVVSASAATGDTVYVKVNNGWSNVNCFFTLLINQTGIHKSSHHHFLMDHKLVRHSHNMPNQLNCLSILWIETFHLVIVLSEKIIQSRFYNVRRFHFQNTIEPRTRLRISLR